MIGRAPKKSSFLQRNTSQLIDDEPAEHYWHHDAWC